MPPPRGPRQRPDLPYPGGEIRLAHDIDEMASSIFSAPGTTTAAALSEYSKPGATFFIPAICSILHRALRSLIWIRRQGRLFWRRSSNIACCWAIQAAFDPRGSRKLRDPIDLDGDGNLDLLVTQRGYNPRRRMILHNDGQMHFAASPNPPRSAAAASTASAM